MCRSTVSTEIRGLHRVTASSRIKGQLIERGTSRGIGVYQEVKMLKMLYLHVRRCHNETHYG